MTAPPGPAMLTAGAGVAVLKLGSLMEKLASASVSQTASAIVASPPARISTLRAKRRRRSANSATRSRRRAVRRL